MMRKLYPKKEFFIQYIFNKVVDIKKKIQKKKMITRFSFFSSCFCILLRFSQRIFLFYFIFSIKSYFSLHKTSLFTSIDNIPRSSRCCISFKRIFFFLLLLMEFDKIIIVAHCKTFPF